VAERLSKEEKKRLKAKAENALQQQALGEWDEHMTMTATELKALCDHLDEWFPRAGCDDTLRLTRAWASERGLDPDDVAASVEHYGAYCDCEVPANLEYLAESMLPHRP